jgi:hypothetical protein
MVFLKICPAEGKSLTGRRRLDLSFQFKEEMAAEAAPFSGWV